MINRYTSTAIEFKTPEKKWSGRPNKYDNLRVFGCTVYAHLNTGKLEPRVVKCIFLGYPEGAKGYRL